MITGSTSGIGLATARALAGEGCNVMLNGFGVSTEIAAKSNNKMACRCDTRRAI